MSTPNERLDKLKRAAKEYIDREKKILNAEYDFLEDILKKRGVNKVGATNSSTASDIFISDLTDFLGS